MMINPNTENRVHFVVRFVAAGAVVCALVWVLMPIRTEAFDIERDVPGENDSPINDTEKLVVSADAFDLTLWYSPSPVVQKSVPKSRPQTQISFELLAISASQEDLASTQKYGVIYDSRDDSIHTLSLGQSIRGYTVSEIDSDSVIMKSGTRTITLLLDKKEDAG